MFIGAYYVLDIVLETKVIVSKVLLTKLTFQSGRQEINYENKAKQKTQIIRVFLERGALKTKNNKGVK